MISRILLGLAVAAALFTTPQATEFSVDTASHTILDRQGRVRVFHGGNAVYKLFPWHPITDHFDPLNSLCKEDFIQLREWGFNVLRLGVMWPGVTPTNGTVNSTYLNVMHGIVEEAAQYNVSILIDLHQDLFAREFCGEGAPSFAVKYDGHKPNFPEPVKKSIPRGPKGLPTWKACHDEVSDFGDFYKTDDVGRAFESLYTDNSVQEAFFDHWSAVAQRFNQTSILGYEIINEPWFGSFIDNPKTLLPGWTERHYLQPLYDKAFEVISQHDTSNLIFFEPIPDEDEVTGTHGFSHGPGGKAQTARQVFSYHVYCPDVTAGGAPKSKFICQEFDSRAFEIMVSHGKTLGGASFLTEFGATGPSEASMGELTRVTGLADKHQQSWIYWAYKPFHDVTTVNTESNEGFWFANGTLQHDKVYTLSRTYPQAVAGRGISYSFDHETSQFLLKYSTSSSAMGETVIYANLPYRYTKGVYLAVTSQCKWTKRWEGNYLYLSLEASTCPEGSSVEVLLRRKLTKEA